MQNQTTMTSNHVRFDFPDGIQDWTENFLKAKKIEGLTQNTLNFYRQELGYFLAFCRENGFEHIAQITPNIIRDYLSWMDDQGHNPGGIHGAYRGLKAFLTWFDKEAEPFGWRNPINKVKAPKLGDEPIEPVEVGDVFRMVEACNVDTFTGLRDKAILLFLLDTGVRARELLAINRADVNQATGAVLVRKGKGRKPRTVFVGEDTKTAVFKYLWERRDETPALWVIDDRTKSLSYRGLLEMIERRAKSARISEIPSPHDFRRAFALTMLRNGCDLITLARLMGHTTLKVLQRYLCQISDDLQAAHQRGGPVDRARAAAA